MTEKPASWDFLQEQAQQSEPKRTVTVKEPVAKGGKQPSGKPQEYIRKVTNNIAAQQQPIDSAIVSMTDSKSNAAAAQTSKGGSRQLKKYSSTTSGTGAGQSLEDFGASNSERFDQFRGRDTTYDESLYTSKLDDGKITAEQRQKGLILEKEIKSQTNTSNRHQLEERGLKELELEKDETGRYESEEMLYSGVVRRDFKKFKAFNAEIKSDAFNQMLTGFIKAKPTTGGFIVDSYQTNEAV